MKFQLAMISPFMPLLVLGTLRMRFVLAISVPFLRSQNSTLCGSVSVFTNWALNWML